MDGVNLTQKNAPKLIAIWYTQTNSISKRTKFFDRTKYVLNWHMPQCKFEWWSNIKSKKFTIPLDAHFLRNDKMKKKNNEEKKVQNSRWKMYEFVTTFLCNNNIALNKAIKTNENKRYTIWRREKKKKSLWKRETKSTTNSELCEMDTSEKSTNNKSEQIK